MKITQSYFDKISERKNTHCVKHDLLGKLYGREDIIPMWVADMDFETPYFIIDAFKERTDHHFFGYSFRDHTFSNSVQRWMKVRHKWEIDTDWVTFCPGIVSAFNIAVLAFSEAGDEVIVQPPVYTPFFGAVTDHGRKMLENPLIYENGNYRMDFDGLRKIITKKTKIILLCTPHNPVGRVWSNKELKELTEICIEHHILIVSDEIHQDLVFSDKKHIPTASMSDAVSAITVTCISPSKTFNMAGLSSSAIIISDEQKRKIFDSYVAKLHIGQGNIFGSIALEAAYNHGDNYVDQLNLYLKKNAESIIDFFGERNSLVFPVRPEATFLIWLDFNKLKIPQKKLNDLLVNNAGVALSDGRIYGRGGSGFQRLNFALPNQLLEKGLSQIKEMIHQQ